MGVRAAHVHFVSLRYPPSPNKEERLTAAWLKNSIALSLLYSLGVIALGLPLVWTFDPHGEGAVFAGLILGAFAVLIPTWIFLVLPRRLGMTLFSLESLSPWVLLVHTPVPTRILSGFILWSLLELPMYGFELLDMLDRTDASITPRRPREAPALFLLWLLALGVAYSVSYLYQDATPMTQYPRAVWVLAYLFLPLPPLIAARQFFRRVLWSPAEQIAAGDSSPTRLSNGGTGNRLPPPRSGSGDALWKR